MCLVAVGGILGFYFANEDTGLADGFWNKGVFFAVLLEVLLAEELDPGRLGRVLLF